MTITRDSIHVLHVDDEPDFADMAAQFLERHNEQIEVRAAPGPEAGLTLLSNNDFDCIVSDYDMPQTNGIEFLQTVREEHPDLPFILYTGKGSEEVASEAVSAGVSDYLQKESGTDHYTVLANRITNLVSQYRAESEIELYTRQGEKTEHYRGRMLDVISETETSTEEKIQQVLALGCERFDVKTGFLVMIDEERDRHEVINVTGSDLVQKGVGNLSETYCRKTIQSDDFMDIANAIEEGWESDPAYEATGLGCYLGGKLSSEDTLFGTVCFVDKTPRDPFTQHELAFFDVLVRWFTQILERRRRQNEADAIFENVQDGIFLVDVLEDTFEIRRVNQAYEAYTGLSAGEITGKAPGEILAEDEAAEVEAQFQKCVQQRAPIEYDEKLTFGGETKYWQTHLAPIIEEGQVTQLVGATRDYTQRKKQEQRYKAIFNQTYQFTGLLEPDGTLIEANESALEFGGLNRDEILGKKLWEVAWFEFSEETRERARSAVEQAAAGNFVRQELQVQGADRDAVIDFSVRPVRNEEGEVILLVPEGRDITERKKRERELRKQGNELEGILDSVEAAIWMRDADNRFLLMNQTYRDLFGIDDDAEVVGKRPADLLSAEIAEQFLASDQRVLTEEAPDVTEETVETEDGPRRFLTRMNPVYDDDGNLFATVGVATDITEQAEREREIDRQKERLNEFASMVSHDLRNPLNIAQGSIELAQEEHESGHLDAAADGVDRSLDLIDDLLALARKGQVIGELESVDVAELVQTCWNTVDTGDAEFVSEVASTIQADRSRLHHLLENLFRNSVDHGGENLTVNVGELDDGFYIEDDGPGIAADREDVFTHGYSTSEGGTGFGLSIVKEIVEAHDWEIRVTESTEGGARFEITGVAFAAE